MFLFRKWPYVLSRSSPPPLSPPVSLPPTIFASLTPHVFMACYVTWSWAFLLVFFFVVTVHFCSIRYRPRQPLVELRRVNFGNPISKKKAPFYKKKRAVVYLIPPGDLRFVLKPFLLLFLSQRFSGKYALFGDYFASFSFFLALITFLFLPLIIAPVLLLAGTIKVFVLLNLTMVVRISFATHLVLKMATASVKEEK